MKECGMHRLVPLLLLLLYACQDQAQNPEVVWTIQELHQEVGLIGGHELACSECHLEASFKSLPSNCEGCHLTDFENTTNPNHLTTGYPIICKECHESTAWEPAVVAHDSLDFPLDGAHALIPCISCHLENDFSSLPTDCVDCHLEDFNEVIDPNHIEQEFSQDCTQCHSVDVWEPATFDHAQTDFPLTGAHANIETNCISCHIGGVFDDLPADCIDCHRENFNEVIDPNHIEQEFSQNCTQCHSVDVWEPATFDHDLTDFPLTGAHAKIETDCISCHIGGVFDNLPADCIDCHREDFNAVEDPNHIEQEFSQDCTQCHSVDVWEPATFDHAQTDFPLTGAHANIETNCISCHIGGVFDDLPADCVDCHQKDEPIDHFGPDCIECHTTTAWEPSTFDHEPLFPLIRGNHRQYRNSCSSCHLAPTDYALFTCTDCHDDEHTRTRTDREHDDVRDYVYETMACFECHPRGSEDDAEGGGDD